jgi:hypothetical protein
MGVMGEFLRWAIPHQGPPGERGNPDTTRNDIPRAILAVVGIL